MKFKPGKIIDRLNVNSKEIIFRYPKQSDAEKAMNFINAVIDEKTKFISRTKKASLEKEKKWIEEKISKMRQNKGVLVFAESNKNIVGCADTFKVNNRDTNRHVFSISISLNKNYRNMGIGTKLLKKIIEQAKSLNAGLLLIDYIEGNKRAKHVYKKLGFKHTGTIPKFHKFGNTYLAKNIMYKAMI